jgi:hypothetical protein
MLVDRATLIKLVRRAGGARHATLAVNAKLMLPCLGDQAIGHLGNRLALGTRCPRRDGLVTAELIFFEHYDVLSLGDRGFGRDLARREQCDQ